MHMVLWVAKRMALTVHHLSRVTGHKRSQEGEAPSIVPALWMALTGQHCKPRFFCYQLCNT